MNIQIWRLMSDNTFTLLSGQGDAPKYHAMERYQIDDMTYHTRKDGLTVGVQATGTHAFRLIQRVTTAFESQYPDWHIRDGLMPLREVDQLIDDPIETIRSDLNETSTNMVYALDSLIRRGERLDVIKDKSDRLRDSSRLFKQKVDSLWSCCYCPLM